MFPFNKTERDKEDDIRAAASRSRIDGWKKSEQEAMDLIPRLGDLSDAEFVSLVRSTRKEKPDYWALIAWTKAVQLELDCRRLLSRLDSLNLTFLPIP